MIRKIFFYLLLSGIFLIACNSNQSKLDNVELLTKHDSINYCIGTNIGDQFIQNSVEVGNPLAIAQGFNDVINENELSISEENKQMLLNELNQQMQVVQRQKMIQEIENNINEGTTFLMENKKKEGVIVTESGLQYKIIREGRGKTPKVIDSVTVHYKGSFVDGTVFESSYEYGTPVTFPVGGVIPGWTEGLTYMKVGAIHELYIPYNLAYGEQGARIIPGGKTLIFQVELLEIK